MILFVFRLGWIQRLGFFRVRLGSRSIDSFLDLIGSVFRLGLDSATRACSDSVWFEYDRFLDSMYQLLADAQPPQTKGLIGCSSALIDCVRGAAKEDKDEGHLFEEYKE